MEEFIEKVIELQKQYRKLIKSKKVTIKDICDLVIPFRDCYNFSDLDALRIARDELSLEEIYKLSKEVAK